MEQVIQRMEHLVNQSKGVWGIVLEDLDKGLTYTLNENRIFYAASIIKLPIMAAVFSLADQGSLHLNEKIELTKPDLVGGSGVLHELSVGSHWSIYDLLMLMIIQSDNTATNILIDRIGADNIRETMQELGMKDSVFYNKLMTVPVNRKGINSVTAADISTFLKQLVKGGFSSHYACEHMIDIMKRQQLHYLTVYYPEENTNIGQLPKWEFASKTGNVTGIHHEAGILYMRDRTMLVTVFSDGCEPREALHIMDEMGTSIYKYMQITS